MDNTLDKLTVPILLLVVGLTACSMGSNTDNRADVTMLPEAPPTMIDPTFAFRPTIEPVIQSPTHENISQPSLNSTIGIGLRAQTIDVLLNYKDCVGLTMAANSALAEQFFPELEGWIRAIGAPSHDLLKSKADKARINGVPYEALAYGLETSRSTPEEEWRNLIKSTNNAKDLVNEYNKLLVMGPGFRLMSRNEDEYAPMAALTDIWMIQTQQLQKDPPGASYREEVARVANLIRTGNPDIEIWAQITLPPDREPNAAEWLEYHQLITDLVEGTYIGVYTWDTVDNVKLITAVEAIFETVCGEDSFDK